MRISVREAAGAALLAAGALCAGIMMPWVMAAGLRALSPFESVTLADGFAAVAIGAWMLVKNP